MDRKYDRLEQANLEELLLPPERKLILPAGTNSRIIGLHEATRAQTRLQWNTARNYATFKIQTAKNS